MYLVIQFRRGHTIATAVGFGPELDILLLSVLSRHAHNAFVRSKESPCYNAPHVACTV